MADREKVIKGLETCIPMKYETNEEKECRHEQCPYGRENHKPMNGCFWDLMADALELLKEQKKTIEALKKDLDILAKRINWHSCSTCKASCDKRPGPGEQVRSNCLSWSDVDGSFVTTSESTKERKR